MDLAGRPPGLGVIEVLRSGCGAVLRRPDRSDTCVTPCSTQPRGTGARALSPFEDESAGSWGLPPDDVEVTRQLDLLAINQDLGPARTSF